MKIILTYSDLKYFMILRIRRLLLKSMCKTQLKPNRKSWVVSPIPVSDNLNNITWIPEYQIHKNYWKLYFYRIFHVHTTHNTSILQNWIFIMQPVSLVAHWHTLAFKISTLRLLVAFSKFKNWTQSLVVAPGLRWIVST